MPFAEAIRPLLPLVVPSAEYLTSRQQSRKARTAARASETDTTPGSRASRQLGLPSFTFLLSAVLALADRLWAWKDRGKRQYVCSRRQLVPQTLAVGLSAVPTVSSGEATRSSLVEVSDAQTYSALAYTPPGASGKLPLIVFLHGAGKNERDVWNLADPKGEHGGLLPSLLATETAPKELADNFAVVAPYSAGKASLYGEPRKKVIQFIEWACSDAGRQAGCPDVDPKRVFLFGFSDGATLGIELMTTRRYAGGVFAAFGFTGELPAFAAERLKDIPIWMFHSADDGIFPVSCSDKFVKTMQKVNSRDALRYTRYDQDQEGFTGRMKGHSVGITASRQPEVYSWLRSI